MSIIDLKDFEYLQSQVFEEFDLFNAHVPYYRVDKIGTDLDDLYHEHVGELKYYPAVIIPLFLDHKPKMQILTRYGFDADRDFLIYISTAVWDRYVASGNTSIVPEKGDKVVFDTMDLRVLDCKPVSYFANFHLGDVTSGSQVHAFYECHVRRIRPGEE